MAAAYPTHRFVSGRGERSLVPEDLARTVATHCASFSASSHLSMYVPTDEEVAAPEEGYALQHWEAAVTAARAALDC